ncbi:hypothetical protein P7C70_g4351, partial [Phenoliferia sp. Uapishka_3]
MTAHLIPEDMNDPLSQHPAGASLKAAGTALTSEECLSPGKQLAGKVCVITGAGSGFGRQYALRAAALGAKIVASDLMKESVDSVVQEIVSAGGVATGILCDVTEWDSQVRMFHAVDTYGVIDIVIANAGVAEMPAWLAGATGPDGEPKRPNFKTYDVNVFGAATTVNLAFYHLNKNPSDGHKAIVIIGSMASFLPIPAAPAYTLSKHAMLGLARSTYYNGVADGINVNIVCPWFVHTPILDTPARLLIAGLPLATVPDVVDAMLYGSSVSDSGLSICVDPTGVLSISQKAFEFGTDGFYLVFANRAKGAIAFVLSYSISSVVRPDQVSMSPYPSLSTTPNLPAPATDFHRKSLERTIKDVIKAIDRSPIGGPLWIVGALAAGVMAYAATRGFIGWIR